MANLIQSRRDEAFLVDEANGHRSREVVTLAGGRAYLSGSVLAAGVGGAYELADIGDTNAVVLLFATNATDGPVKATVIARDAEVKAGLISGAQTATPTLLATALADNGIIVRDSF